MKNTITYNYEKKNLMWNLMDKIQSTEKKVRRIKFMNIKAKKQYVKPAIK